MSIFSRAVFTTNKCLGIAFRASKFATRPSNNVFAVVNDVLKMDSYESRRKIAQEKIKSGKNDFLVLVAEELEPEKTANARNLKELMFLAELEDIDLVLAGLKKLELQSSNLRLTNFHTDATVMRMFYYLNAAEQAYATFVDPSFRQTYVGYNSVLILLQLLYNNAMYSNILDCVDLLEKKQCWNVWSSDRIALFYVVACIKLNTHEVHERAVLYVEKCKTYRNPSSGPALAAAYCALQTNHTKVNSFLECVAANQRTAMLKFNILLQLLIKEKNLVLVLDLLETCKHALTKDTVDVIAASLDGKSGSDLKSFITENLRVLETTLPDSLIELCIKNMGNEEQKGKQGSKTKQVQLEEVPLEEVYV